MEAKKAAPTKGPWRFNGSAITSPEGKAFIARVWMMREGEGVANGHLMAAAPEVTGALQNILFAIDISNLREHEEIAKFIVSAEAALAKARGGQA